MTSHLQRLSPAQRALLFQIVSADADGSDFAQLAIDTWSEVSFSGDRDRAFLELYEWLSTIRQSLGLPGVGHA